MRLDRRLLALCLSCTLTAHAGDAAKARALFKEGEAALDARRGPAAVAAFKASYAESQAASLLFFLGEAYRLVGDRGNAIASYQEYLAKLPGGPHQADAQAHLAALKAGHAQQAVPKMRLEVGLDLDLTPVKHKATRHKKGSGPAAEVAAAKPAPAPDTVEAGVGGDLTLDLSETLATTPPPASVPSPAEANPPAAVKPAEANPPAAVKPAEVSVAPAAPPEKAPAPFQPSPVVAAPPEPGPRPGFKLTACLSAGLGVLSRPTYYSAASNTTTDRETAPEFGLDVEAGWRFGALSLALQLQAFTSGSPEVFGKDLVVPFTAGPRLEFASGSLRLGLAVSYPIAPRTYWLGFDVGVGADVGLQFHHFGVRLTAGALFGTGAYLTQEGGTIRTSNTTLIPVRLGLVWDY